jgi:superfamily II DNA or RNA helicase
MDNFICIITIDDNRYCTLKSTIQGLNKIEREFISIDYSKCFVYGKFRKELAVKISLLVRKENTQLALLPIGLLNRLIEFIKKENGRYKVIDNREFDKYNFTDDEIKQSLYSKSNKIILRDYQVDALKVLFNNYIGIIKASTGAGKTEMFTSLCKLMNKKTLILFKEIKLAHQTMKRMKGANIDAGIVQGNNLDEDHKVIMCTVQSSHKLCRTDYEMVIVDECHNASQNRYQDILSSNFKYRFGFSATPFNSKNKHKNNLIERWLGNIIYNVSSKHLVDEGHLAKPIITFIRINKVLKDVKRKGIIEEKEVDIDELKWQAAEKNGIVKNHYRNKIIKILANTLPGTVLTLVKYVDSHGEKLHETMNDALFLSGKNKLKERDLAVEMLERNEIKTIIASTIFDEGIDIKRINNVILAGGGKSYEKTIQRIGRGMRKFIDENGIEKTDVKVFDFYDETHPILLRHSKERVKYMKEEGYDVKIIDVNEIKNTLLSR